MALRFGRSVYPQRPTLILKAGDLPVFVEVIRRGRTTGLFSTNEIGPLGTTSTRTHGLRSSAIASNWPCMTFNCPAASLTCSEIEWSVLRSSLHWQKEITAETKATPAVT